MGFMETMQAKMDATLVPVASKLNGQRHVAADKLLHKKNSVFFQSALFWCNCFVEGYYVFGGLSLVPVASKLNGQRHVAAVRDAFTLAFPLTLAGSIITLVNFAVP